MNMQYLFNHIHKNHEDKTIELARLHRRAFVENILVSSRRGQAKHPKFMFRMHRLQFKAYFPLLSIAVYYILYIPRDEEADQVGVGWTTSENSEASHGCDKHKKDPGGMVMKRPSFCSRAIQARQDRQIERQIPDAKLSSLKYQCLFSFVNETDHVFSLQENTN